MGLVIDLGSEQRLTGFKYLPEQGRWISGLITRYAFDVSKDGESWTPVSEGEFSNIKNNPVWQLRRFEPTAARFIRLRALANTDGNSRIGYAEVDMLTPVPVESKNNKGEGDGDIETTEAQRSLR